MADHTGPLGSSEVSQQGLLQAQWLELVQLTLSVAARPSQASWKLTAVAPDGVRVLTGPRKLGIPMGFVRVGITHRQVVTGARRPTPDSQDRWERPARASGC